MTESFTQRNSSRENDRLSAEEYVDAQGRTMFIPRTQTIPAGYTTKITYTVTKKPEYIGMALPGTATSAASWQIRKLVYNVDDKPSEIVWADGDRLFNNIWDNRASLSYS